MEKYTKKQNRKLQNSSLLESALPSVTSAPVNQTHKATLR